MTEQKKRREKIVNSAEKKRRREEEDEQCRTEKVKRRRRWSHLWLWLMRSDSELLWSATSDNNTKSEIASHGLCHLALIWDLNEWRREFSTEFSEFKAEIDGLNMLNLRKQISYNMPYCIVWYDINIVRYVSWFDMCRQFESKFVQIVQWIVQ